MSGLKIRRPEYKYFAHLPEQGFSISRNTAIGLDGLPSTLDWFGIKMELMKLGDPTFYLPDSSELDRAYKALQETDPATAVSMLQVRTERTDSIVCLPNKNDSFPELIEPHLQRGRYPVLIQGSDGEIRGSKKIIKGGERFELPNFPNEAGKINFNLQELGIERGAYIFLVPYHHNEEGQGLRNIVRGNYNPSTKKRYVLAVKPPWQRDDFTQFRLFNTKAAEPSIEDFMKGTA